MIASNAFDKLPEAFLVKSQKDDNEYLKILGRKNNRRVYAYIKREYVISNPFISSYNLAITEANGSGDFGERLSDTVVLSPEDGCTDTFISVGTFENRVEVDNLQKYLKTKFFRTLLGVLKVTQHNPGSVWQNVPLQEFALNSDIDWNLTVQKIDQQLYKKYGLTNEEIAFIESKVQEMK
jgi:hypothetical protein